MYRLYYAFSGTNNLNRRGGIWWYKDFKFNEYEKLINYINTIKPFCDLIYKTRKIINHDLMNIVPPKTSNLIFKKLLK